MRLRWIVNEDGTRRLQFADTYIIQHGGDKYWDWQDVPEVPEADEWNALAPEPDK